VERGGSECRSSPLLNTVEATQPPSSSKGVAPGRKKAEKKSCPTQQKGGKNKKSLTMDAFGEGTLTRCVRGGGGRGELVGGVEGGAKRKEKQEQIQNRVAGSDLSREEEPRRRQKKKQEC